MAGRLPKDGGKIGCGKLNIAKPKSNNGGMKGAPQNAFKCCTQVSHGCKHLKPGSGGLRQGPKSDPK